MSADTPDRDAEIDPLDLLLEGKSAGRSPRQLFPLVVQSIRLVWSAGRRDFAYALVLQLLPAILAGVQIVLTRNVLSALLRVDRGTSPGSELVLPLVTLGIVTAVSVTCLLSYAQQQRVLNEVVQREVWRRILEVTGSVDLESFEDPAFFDQLNRVENNAIIRPVQVTQSVVTMLGGALASIGLAVALISLQPLLLPLLGLAAVPMLVFGRRGAKTEFGFIVAQTPAHRERIATQQLLTGRDPAKELRAYGLEEVLLGRWDERYNYYVDGLRRQVSRRIRLSLVGNGLSALVATSAAALLAVLVATHRMSLADAGAAALAARGLASRSGQGIRGSGSLAEASLFLADLQSFLDLGAHRLDEEVAIDQTALPSFSRLRLDNVSFEYPTSGNTAVDGVSMEIRAGEVVALVGENGSGKTTLAKMLALLYTPTSGRICWDETDLATVDPVQLRREIAVVFQDFVHYPLSARDNIGLGRADGLDDIDGIEGAARQAGAHDFLSTLPAGYDTYLSKLFKGGRDLSLGQWQRVMLARAFYRNSPFVILDEPTASLDPRAEHELFRAIRTLLAGRTVLLISHRFSSVRSADRIYVMRTGRLVEAGSHQELMRQGGLYNELFTLQAAGYH